MLCCVERSRGGSDSMDCNGRCEADTGDVVTTFMVAIFAGVNGVGGGVDG